MLLLEARSTGELKCIHANAHRMGSKQEELEAIVQQENHDIVTIAETWWNDLCDWSAAVDGYRLLRRNRQGKRGRGVALYVRECISCLEINAVSEKVECLWVKIGGRQLISW